MSADEVFRRMVATLDRAGIPFMLTGSFASSLHGVVRATQDIDLVIAPTAEQLRELVADLPADEYYVDLDAALDALRRQTQFNIIDLSTGWKIDLVIRRDRAFSRQEFDRRQPVEYADVRLHVATAEDVIIAKLEWSKMGGSRRQIEDAAGVIRLRADEIDRSYIEAWVEQLGLMEQWGEARRIAGEG